MLDMQMIQYQGERAVNPVTTRHTLGTRLWLRLLLQVFLNIGGNMKKGLLLPQPSQKRLSSNMALETAHGSYTVHTLTSASILTCKSVQTGGPSLHAKVYRLRKWDSYSFALTFYSHRRKKQLRFCNQRKLKELKTSLVYDPDCLKLSLQPTKLSVVG